MSRGPRSPLGRFTWSPSQSANFLSVMSGVENVSEWVDMYSSVAALPLNTFVIVDKCLKVAINYCDLPHLLQNLACVGIEAPQIMQFFVEDPLPARGLGSSMSTGLRVGSVCCGEGRVYSLPPPAAGGPTVPPVPTKPPMPNPA